MQFEITHMVGIDLLNQYGMIIIVMFIFNNFYVNNKIDKNSVY